MVDDEDVDLDDLLKDSPTNKKRVKHPNEILAERDKKLAELAKKDGFTLEELSEDNESQEEVHTTLEDVYKTVEKWLHIRLRDRNRIDVELATKLSEAESGEPLWIIIIGASGDWKTAFTRAFFKTPNTIVMDQITENTLASGKEGRDLGYELQDSFHTLVFPDLACMMSIKSDKKDIIWGQFRNLYDGYVIKQTGNLVNKKYSGCHVTLIACATESIRSEILMKAHLGTRELFYDTETDPIDNRFKMKKALENAKYKEKMNHELHKVVSDFLSCHKVLDIEPDADMIEFMMSEALRLTVLRATATYDRTNRELNDSICPEVPTRLIQQFYKLYRSLKSLDTDYPDEKCREIISHIVDSSGDKIRQKVMTYVQGRGSSVKMSEICEKLRIGRTAVKMQCEALWNLRIFKKETRTERIGGYIDPFDPHEQVRGGLIKEVDYFEFCDDFYRGLLEGTLDKDPCIHITTSTHNKQSNNNIPRGTCGVNALTDKVEKSSHNLKTIASIIKNASVEILFIEDIIEDAEKKGVEESETREIVERLEKKGCVFHYNGIIAWKTREN